MNWQTCAVCPVHVHVRRRCNAFISTESYNKPTLTQVPAIDCCVCNIYPSQLLETLCFTAVQVYNVQSAAAHIVPRCSMTFSDAETLLFQSAERALIDVKSIHVATNEMEEILHLLTERDIEHTNNPPTLLCSFLRPPIFSISQTYTLRSNSVNISPSVSASLCLCYHVHFHKAFLHSDRSLHIFSACTPFHLFTSKCFPFLSFFINFTC